jgi:hypothetical protein
MARPEFSFVSGPYKSCPECGADRFGRLMVNGSSYVRRCDECRHTASFELPEVHKTMVYLDQFAISGMMKALNPRHPGTKGAKEEGWLGLFERLDRLSKLQLLVCPESPAHEAESSLYAPGFLELQRLYEHLSNGVSFKQPEQILGRQVYRHAADWIRRELGEPLELFEHDAIRGTPNAWTDTLRVSVHFPIDEDEIQESRRRRDAGARDLEPVFRRWQADTNRTFDDWYREELDGWPEWVWTDFLSSTGRFLAGLAGERELDADDFFPPTSSREMLHILIKTVREAGVSENDALDVVHDFLGSGTFERVPRIRISSLLWAGLAHQAAHGGRKKPPNRGMMTDVNTVSSVLPYCDAILVDSEVRTLLEFGPVKQRLGFSSTVFSKSSLPDLVTFLDRVEAGAPPDHLAMAIDIYGEPDVYSSILQDPPR